MKEEQAKALFFAQYLGQKVQFRGTQPDDGYDKAIPFENSIIRQSTLIGITNDNDGNFEPEIYQSIDEYWMDVADYKLLLRSVSQLTDEEIKNLLSILECHYKGVFNKIIVVDGKRKWLRVWVDYPKTDLRDEYKDILLNLSDDKNMITNCRGNDYYRTLSVAKEYLKLIGVLTSFTYLNETNAPVTLQPHEIIAMGWVKLLTD